MLLVDDHGVLEVEFGCYYGVVKSIFSMLS